MFSIAILNPLLCPHRRIAREPGKVLETSALGVRGRKTQVQLNRQLRCAAFRRPFNLKCSGMCDVETLEFFLALLLCGSGRLK